MSGMVRDLQYLFLIGMMYIGVYSEKINIPRWFPLLNQLDSLGLSATVAHILSAKSGSEADNSLMHSDRGSMGWLRF
jgi:hypothetical protein